MRRSRFWSPGTPTTLGSFELEFIHMAHSIPDSCAVVLRTELGPILITGDYKFDQTPVDGNPADVSRLAALGSRGPAVPVRDSTNADRPGIAPSESSVGPALLDLMARCQGRIIVTSFASNVHRVQQVIDAAAQLDRKVALVGRSMRKNFNIARNLGIADAPDGMLIPPGRSSRSRTTRWSRSPPEARASPCPRCGAWPTPITRTSSFTRATP